MDHVGSISAERGYTLAQLAQIIQQSKENESKSERVKFSTVRDNLKRLGCPMPKFGGTVIVPGRLILLALERCALQEFNDNG